MSHDSRKPLYHYWTPKHWPVWLCLGLLRLSCLLPYRWQLAIGRRIGRIGHRYVPKRRAIVRRNLSLAFPELSVDERNALALQHFEALGISLMELALARWGSDSKHRALTRIEGVEHIERAVRDGRGIIFLSAHFTTLEISGRILKQNSPPFDLVFRRFRDDFLTEIIRTTREISGRQTIEKSDIKRMVRSLRSGTPVWYAPDQSYNRKTIRGHSFFRRTRYDEHRYERARASRQRRNPALLAATTAGGRLPHLDKAAAGKLSERRPGSRYQEVCRGLRGARSTLSGAVLLDTSKVQESAGTVARLLC